MLFFLYNQKLNKKYYFQYYQNISSYPIINAIFNILSNRDLYYKVMNNKLYIKHSLEYYKLFDGDKSNDGIYYCETYYPYDYAFPNINLIFG